jgi:hypothetical protein
MRIHHALLVGAALLLSLPAFVSSSSGSGVSASVDGSITFPLHRGPPASAINVRHAECSGISPLQAWPLNQ